MNFRFIIPLFLTPAILFVACNKSGDVQQPGTPAPEKPYIVSTYAGNIGHPGFQDGPSLTAQFNVTGGLAMDPQGVIYTGDLGNNRVRRIALDSSVSTFAGSGVMGFNDGPAATAQFIRPADVAVDASGNIIVVDIGNHRIRKITPAGMVSTIAGSGIAGYLDGPAATAMFNEPQSICIDAAGNMYVADLRNYRIRKISASGIVSTVAGNGNIGYVDGNALSAEFNQPFDVEVDGQGNIYVADNINCVIRKVSNSGVVSTYAGSVRGYKDGPADSAQFLFPFGIVLDPQGNLYVSDCYNHRIRKVTPNRIVSTIAGKGTAGITNGNADIAEFAEPHGIAFRNGVLYISDRLTYSIRKISK